MATTEHFYTGNNSTTSFAFQFPYLSNSDVKVELNNVVKTENSSGQTDNDYTINNTNIVFNSAPGTGVAIHIYRTTNVDSAQAQYAAGSSIRAADLNNNQTQVLYSAQEAAGQKVRQGDLKDNIIVSSNIIDGTITTADLADNSVATAKIADSAITDQKIANNAVVSAKIPSSAITTAKIADSAITNAKIQNNAVVTAKIPDSAITQAKIQDGAINSAKISSNAITTVKIAADAVTTAKIADLNVVTSHIANNNITTAKIADSNVVTSHIADDAVTTAKIADDAVTTDKIANANITTAKIADNAVTAAKIASRTITADRIAGNSITASELNNSCVEVNELANNAVATAKIQDDAVTTVKIGGAQVTDAKLASNSVVTSKITDANVTTDKIANSNITLGKLHGDLKQTTISNSDTQLPTSGAVVDYVAAQIAPIGGLEVIATDAAFPNTQPQAGVVISIADAGGLVVNGSGTSTTGRTVGGSTVTINNIASNFNNSTVDAGVCFQVSSTGSGQVYNYHKATLKESDLLNLSNDINDFGNRYRVGSSNPTSGLDAGDLFFNTSTQKLLVYNSTNSAWEEAQSVGNFFISTFSESFDNSRTQFTVSNAPANAQQLIISINGVIQKPNSGTGQPSEGFTLSGSTVTFSAAIPSGSDYFAVVLGSTVNVGAPSDGTVTAAKLTSGAVETAKIADDAVTEVKLGVSNSPTNGYFLSAQSGNTGGLTWAQVSTDLVADTSPQLGGNLESNTKSIVFADSANDSDDVLSFGNAADMTLFHRGNHSYIRNKTGETYLQGNNSGTLVNNIIFGTNGVTKLCHLSNTKFETTSAGATVTGGLTVTADVAVTSLSTFSGGLKTSADTSKIQLGASDDLEIWHSSNSNSYIKNSTGELKIASDNIALLTTDQSEKHIQCTGNGAVEIYHNNSKKFETTSGGIEVSGGANFTSGNVSLTDNSKIKLGTADDLQLYHDGSGSTSYITDNGALIIRGDGLQLQRPNGNMYLKCIAGNTVELYFDNTKVLATVSNGIKLHTGGSSAVEFYDVNTSTIMNYTHSVNLRWYDHVNDDNIMQLSQNGDLNIDGSYSNSGVDYAEYFESTDGSAIAIGTTVVLEDGKVRAATSSETPIGVIRPKTSGTSVTGGVNQLNWQGKYLVDDYDGQVMESAVHCTWVDDDKKDQQCWKDRPPTGVTIPSDAVETTRERPKLNPLFDESKTYVPRSERDEWNCVGLLGQIPITKGQPTSSNWIKMKDKTSTVELWMVK